MFNEMKTFLTALYAVLDDICQSACAQLLASKPGPRYTYP